MLYTCEVCGKVFHSWPAKHPRFCSITCRGIGRRSGEVRSCVVCGKEFYIIRARVLRGDAKYCSRSCLAKVHLAQYWENWLAPSGTPPRAYKTVTVNGETMYEHRKVMEDILGRKLTHDEHVHHINGDPLDNRPENLQVLVNSDHQKIEIKHRKRFRDLGASSLP